MRIKDDDVMPTDEAGNVCQVIHSIEPEAEPPDLICLRLLGGATQLTDVLKILITKASVVVWLQVQKHWILIQGSSYHVRGHAQFFFSHQKQKSIK